MTWFCSSEASAACHSVPVQLTGARRSQRGCPQHRTVGNIISISTLWRRPTGVTRVTGRHTAGGGSSGNGWGVAHSTQLPTTRSLCVLSEAELM